MKVRELGMALVGGIFLMSSNVLAADKSLSSVESAAAPVEAPQRVEAPKVDPKVVAKIREKVEKLKKGIDGSEWEIELGSRDPKAKSGPDKLLFQNGMVTVESLAKRGFGPTNYTVSVPSPDSDMGIFETMQVAKDGIVFLRGEWKDKSMQGIINEQLEGGKVTRESWFTSSAKPGIAPKVPLKAEEKVIPASDKKTAETETLSSVKAEADDITEDAPAQEATQIVDETEKAPVDDEETDGNKGWF